ncbi:capsular biosynthesis protein [Listeria sp. FSL L7-1582]|uniref:YveK family protein n=1 Tax=Listeria portnoyi TaxID=2713504 RepID=UPI00164DAD68|nr:Wzz/FepE/Etk N-terminal domain-containing protein [Listeria portnoyi]MBC6308694.1 capsular biosynthesis protein [Listeria portnoyi]
MKLKNLTVGNIWKTFKKSFVWLILIICLALASVYTYSNYVAKPEYTSSFQILLNAEQTDAQAKSSEGVRNNIQLINTFTSVLQSGKIMDLVKEKVKTDDSSSKLSADTKITSNENSLVLTINYTGTDSKKVSEISTAMLNVVSEEIPSIFKGTTVTVLEKSSAPTTPSNNSMYILAIMVGCLLSATLLFVLCSMDTTVQNMEQLENIGLPFLGDIPKFKSSEL